MSINLLIHIGYHKTATSWLQARVFVPRHGYHSLCNHREISDLIIRPHNLWFDPDPARRIIEDRRSKVPQGAVPVLSSEDLSGHPFYGGFGSDVYAERLKAIVPNAKILISIRDQMKIIPSVYMHYILRGGTMTPEQFLAGTNTPGYRGFSPRHFEYDRLVSRYGELFGRESVYVLTQESLRSDVSAAIRGLAAFSGNGGFAGLTASDLAPVGVNYPEYASHVLRRINHIQRSQINPQPIISLGESPWGLYKLAGYMLKTKAVRSLAQDYKPVTRRVRMLLSGQYAESNQRLLRSVAHPLDLHGYDGV